MAREGDRLRCSCTSGAPLAPNVRRCKPYLRGTFGVLEGAGRAGTACPAESLRIVSAEAVRVAAQLVIGVSIDLGGNDVLAAVRGTAVVSTLSWDAHPAAVLVGSAPWNEQSPTNAPPHPYAQKYICTPAAMGKRGRRDHGFSLSFLRRSMD